MIAFDDLPHFFFFFSILKIPKPSSSLSHFLISPFCTSNHQLFCFSFIKQLSQYLVWLINGNGDTRATDISLSLSLVSLIKSKQQQRQISVNIKHTKEEEEEEGWQS